MDQPFGVAEGSTIQPTTSSFSISLLLKFESVLIIRNPNPPHGAAPQYQIAPWEGGVPRRGEPPAGGQPFCTANCVT